MTLPDQVEINNMQNKKVEQPIGEILEKVLTRAKKDDRVTGGVSECASVLESDPDKVMLCLLPEATPDDIVMKMQHKLIEAHCLENDIHVVKINNTEKFSLLLGSDAPHQKTVNDNPVTTPSIDCSCVLVAWPAKENKNKHENKLMDKIWPNQVIDLPI